MMDKVTYTFTKGDIQNLLTALDDSKAVAVTDGYLEWLIALEHDLMDQLRGFYK